MNQSTNRNLLDKQSEYQTAEVEWERLGKQYAVADKDQRKLLLPEYNKAVDNYMKTYESLMKEMGREHEYYMSGTYAFRIK